MTGKACIAGAALVSAVLRGNAALGASFAVSAESFPRMATAIASPRSELTCTQPRSPALLKHVMAHCGAIMFNTSPMFV